MLKAILNKRVGALLAAFGATTIYGLNHTIAKGAMPDYVGAFGFIMLRVGGAAILFWTLSLFTPKEKIQRKDSILTTMPKRAAANSIFQSFL